MIKKHMIPRRILILSAVLAYVFVAENDNLNVVAARKTKLKILH